MIVRSLDGNGDWTFGKGRNNYLVGNQAIMQSIATRLRSFLGDCFFALDAGLDWFNLLGSKNQIALELAVRATISNTYGVTKLISASIDLDELSRQITMKYTVETIYTVSDGTAPISSNSTFLLTEDGDILTTEDGDEISLG